MGRELIHEPFAVINADDFYGRESFQVLADYLTSIEGAEGKYCMVGYRVCNTLSENGAVSRGVCTTDENGCLTEKGCADYSMFILGKLITRPNGLGEWLYVGTIGLTDNLVVTTEPGDDENLYYVTINRGDESINNWDELHSVQFVVNSKRAALYRVDEMTYSTSE
jgi:hypothetical protein